MGERRDLFGGGRLELADDGRELRGERLGDRSGGARGDHVDHVVADHREEVHLDGLATSRAAAPHEEGAIFPFLEGGALDLLEGHPVSLDRGEAGDDLFEGDAPGHLVREDEHGGVAAGALEPEIRLACSLADEHVRQDPPRGAGGRAQVILVLPALEHLRFEGGRGGRGRSRGRRRRDEHRHHRDQHADHEEADHDARGIEAGSRGGLPVRLCSVPVPSVICHSISSWDRRAGRASREAGRRRALREGRE